MSKHKHTITTWDGCYPSNWNGKIVPEAMSHPAKYSSRLIRKIYEHIISEGWAQAGDSVVDPFGGVALGALDAMRLGLHWQGVELEAKFHGLGNLNIEKWNAAHAEIMPTWGTARLHNGDSRYLAQVLDGSAAVSVSSPPFTDSLSTDLLTKTERVQRARELGISDAAKISPIDMEKIGMRHQSDYGSTPGQLGAMKAQGFDVAIASPPFLQSEGGTPEPKAGGVIDKALYARHAAGNKSANGYGRTDGQLSSMKDGSFDVAVSSPPYEETTLTENRQFKSRHSPDRPGAADLRNNGGDAYGKTNGQLGVESGNDFWLSAKAIVEQVYTVLTPGGHACWVVKDYVKNKQIVPFCDQWRQLCEAVGFTTIHEHHASLVRNVRHQHTLEGGLLTMQSESKSFFRRIAEKKGSPRIDYETVFCMEKPL